MSFAQEEKNNLNSLQCGVCEVASKQARNRGEDAGFSVSDVLDESVDVRNDCIFAFANKAFVSEASAVLFATLRESEVASEVVVL